MGVIMKAKLLIEGKELEVEISEEEYKKLQPAEEKKTGYERMPKDNNFYYVVGRGNVDSISDYYTDIGDDCYDTANYYSSKTIAENNARADKLMRQLRRFAVEHRESKIDQNDCSKFKYYISYDYKAESLFISSNYFIKQFGGICFDTKAAAREAKKEFDHELIWYFTEYQDGL